jgi:hypothetical protein
MTHTQSVTAGRYTAVGAFMSERAKYLKSVAAALYTEFDRLYESLDPHERARAMSVYNKWTETRAAAERDNETAERAHTNAHIVATGCAPIRWTSH